jgi:hypothetical protein
MSATLNSLRRTARQQPLGQHMTEHEEYVASIGDRLTAQQNKGIAQMRSNETVPMMNEAQKGYVLSLLQRMSQVHPEMYATAKPWCDARMDTLTKRRASEVIDRLKAQLASAPVQAAPVRTWDAYTDIPTGYYAVSSDEGHTSLYRVQHRDGGKVYVDLQVSDALTRIPWATRQAALNKIRTDGPQACAERYGREIRRCYRCNRKLTLEESRTNGLGATCAGKVGW